MADDLKLLVNGYYVTGWTHASFTAGIERFPRAFSVELTEPLDSNNSALGIFTERMPIMVYIGNDKVLTGYIDEVSCEVSHTSHTVTVTGRSMTEDMVDCSAELADNVGTSMGNSTTLLIAQKLVSPYGITVKSGQNGKASNIPQFTVNLGETSYQIVERVARYSGFLVYDDADGNLILSEPATEPKTAGRLVQGSQIISAKSSFNVCERYGKYEFYSHSYQSTMDQQAALVASAGHYGPDNDASHGVATDSVFDQYKTPYGAPRNRKLIQIADMPLVGPVTANIRAAWEMNRRMGRSQHISLALNTWRDADGKLFRPNSLVSFSVPSVRLTDKEWLIADLTFTKSKDGTICQMELMPKQAFDIEPFDIAPMDVDTQKAITDSTGDVPNLAGV